MTPGLRRALLALFLLPLALGAVLVARALPHPGEAPPPAARWISASAQRDRHVTNAAVSVTFDHRALDTLGEELILSVTALGVTLLLRLARRDVEEAERRQWVEEIERALRRVSPAVRVIGSTFVAPLFLFGLYVAAHGHLTPGGGFQAGVILAGAGMLAILTGSRRTLHTADPVRLIEAAEAAGLLGLLGAGTVGLLLGGALFFNVLPPGTLGSLASGGLIPVLNLLSAAVIACGIVLIAVELLEQAAIARGGKEDGP